MIKDIVIVGGGTSGWLAAAYLNYQLPKFKLTIIDKEVGTPVGVGEGTLLDFGDFLKGCGFDENEWFNFIDAVPKSGILFPNWVSKHNDIWHPFELGIRNNKLIKGGYNSNVSAFNIDCSKLVYYIQNKLKKKIKIIKSDVVEIKRENDVKYIKLKNNKKIKSDLYINCTGWKNIFKYKDKKQLLNNRLMCDTAVAAHVSYNDKQKEQHNYVVSEAVESGWIWKIPVQSRIGSGFVFNRSITKVEDAKNYFIKYWNNRITKDKIKVLDWTPFYLKNPWQNNVVNIGLSSGFLEPLESTGIAIIMRSIFNLTKRICTSFYTKNDIDVYNKTMEIMYEDCIDFVSMHYCNSKRKEKFWKKANKKIKTSDLHKKYLNVLKVNKNLKHFVNNKFQDVKVFTGANWFCWLTQMKYKKYESK
jgi:tryptophan 7-halogenase